MTATAVQLTALISPTEREFTAQVMQLLHLYSWTAAHFRPARRADGSWRTPLQGDGAGFPDIIAVRKNRTLAIELKAERGRLDPLQHRWLDALEACPGIETFCWRPSDWQSLVEVLK